DAPDGVIEVTVGPHPSGASPIEWTYEQDEDPVHPPSTKTAVLVPAFTAPCLQALTVHPAADPPLRLEGDTLVRAAAPDDPGLAVALARFNAGDMD
ncbi:hypothetical protein, partial [Flavihumibacter cheonanensis]|uniref:hypothetical protein n=1 Tax=Flavihumibacter cheonanensis TaxID=1442385 RepID=UPI001EF9B40C